MPRAVVLVIDGLGARHLGPYGNTWLDTPAFNHLAASSLLLDDVYAPFADPWRSLESMWRGRASVSHHVDVLRDTDLISWLNSQNVATFLLSDDPNLVDQRLTSHFAAQTDVAPASGVKLAAEWDETHAAGFFAQAVSAVQELESNSTLWLHTRGLGNPWDAPYDYRRQFADEEDPDPSGSAQVPALQLDADYDPDTLHEMQCALAGQVTLLDQCLGVLLAVVREMQDVLFVVTSLRGFPLGEHRVVGWERPAVFPELLHVPAFMRFPDGALAMRRSQTLGELSDVTREIANWFDVDNSSNVDDETNVLQRLGQPARSCSLCRADGDVLLRTPAWHVRFPDFADDETSSAKLYLKPDDQNEVNDVASLRGDVVEAGRELMSKLSQTENVSTPDVPDVLLVHSE